MIFYDATTQTAVITGTTAALNTPVTKRISGLYWMTTGTTFDFAFADLDWPNAESYPLNQVECDSSDFGIPDYFLQGGPAVATDITGWTTAWDDIDDSYADTLAISVANYRLCGGPATYRTRPLDWGPEAWNAAAPLDVLIDTYTDDATNGAMNIIENFNGESQRVYLTGAAFNPAVFLATNELMQFCGTLRVQDGDWTAYLPHNGTTIINPNYVATGAANQYYYRFYTTDGSTRSGGLFTFNGLTELMLSSGNVLIDISLDAVNWYSLNADFIAPPLLNGSGCRTNSGTITAPTIEFTLASYTTNNAVAPVPANSIMLRITMPNTSAAQLQSAHLQWY